MFPDIVTCERVNKRTLLKMLDLPGQVILNGRRYRQRTPIIEKQI